MLVGTDMEQVLKYVIKPKKVKCKMVLLACRKADRLKRKLNDVY